MSNDRPIKILFLTAEPTDSARLRLGRELEDIKERLRLANPQGMFVLEQRLSARPQDISQAIQDFQPNIVHFSGHGESTGELCFENELGKTQSVTPEALAALFRLVTAHVNCVVLNACYSDIQALAIVEHIPFVIGMKRAIADKAAIAFAVGFYKALGANRTIEEAYEFACVEIQLQGIPEESTPVLRKKQQRCLRQADATAAMFYLERPTIEKRCYEEIKQPGSLIRIKAPENMGKTWLMNRIVAYARGNGYKTVSLSIKGLVDGICSDEETFLRSLCVAVSDELELPNNLNQHWDDKLSCIFNCTMYFQKYLLTNFSPVVLALNYLDLVFEQPAIANNFCNMLRDWHDKARRGDKVSEIWQKLRLVIYYKSGDIYSESLKKTFEKFFINPSRKIVRSKDLADQKLDARYEIYLSANNDKADAIVFFPNTELIYQVINIAHEQQIFNSRNLQMLGGDSLYSSQISKRAKDATEGLILAIPWFNKSSNTQQSKFVKDAINRWQGEKISWRMATSYDATQAFIKAMSSSDNPSRQSVLEKLPSIDLSPNETSGNRLKFIEGEPKKEPVLVQVVNSDFVKVDEN